MASSPTSTASSSDLYAHSEPIEEQNSDQPLEHEHPQAGKSTPLHGISSPTNNMRTESNDKIQREDDKFRREEIFARQANANTKRKREDDLETSYAIIAKSGSMGPIAPEEYLARQTEQVPRENFVPSSGPKRIRINGFSPTKAGHAELGAQSVTLPAELWHHVFRFVPPVFLGRLLRVNRAFHSYLTSTSTEPITAESSIHSGVQPLDAESIWTASRKRFAPGLPKPLRESKELDMWRLLRGRACQLCGQARDPGAVSGIANPWESGPGERGVRIIWSFGIRSCGPCLESCSEKVSMNLEIHVTLVLPY